MKKMWLCTLALSSFLLSNAFAGEDITINPFKYVALSNHKVILLNHGLASLEKRLEMIESAKKTIEVEYFIYRTDLSSKMFTDALVKKAREGVKVRMLLDYFMVKSEITPFHMKALQDEGIEVRYFNDASLFQLASNQYRNHRKLLLVDGKEVITGGRNIGNEYFDMDPDYNFLDREMAIEGRVVPEILSTFNETFVSKLSKKFRAPSMPSPYNPEYGINETMDTRKYEADLKDWKKKTAAAEAFVRVPLVSEEIKEVRKKGKELLDQEYKGSCDKMGFHSEYPSIGKKNRKTNRVIKHEIFDRIKETSSSLMIDSPYFIVNDELGEALSTALDKKVDVKVLTNSLNSTDAIYVYAAFDSIATEWLEKGVDSYIFRGDRPASYGVLPLVEDKTRFGVHAKTFVFDNKDVVVGTFNVDPRSANFNAEMVVSCDNNPELAKAIQDDIDSRLAESIHLDSKEAIKEAEFYQVKFGKKILYYLLKLPSNIFSFLL